jgi:hypothetical protein
VGPLSRETSRHSHPKAHTPLGRLQLSGYRYYNPKLGRWGSRDPLGDASHLRFAKRGESFDVRRRLRRSSLEPSYLAIKNASVNRYDFLGREAGIGIPCKEWLPDGGAKERAVNCGIDEMLKIITDNFQRALDEALDDIDTPIEHEAVKQVLKAAYDHLTSDIWGGESDAMKHCRVSCAMAVESEAVAGEIGYLTEFLDALGSELGLSSYCQVEDFSNNAIGVTCAKDLACACSKFKSCEDCCENSDLVE